jgi:hypothetical protein
MRILCFLFLAIAVSGCAGLEPTAYQPENNAGYGYRAVQTGPESYLVSFAGNRVTPQEVAEAGMLRRAAELARQRGYERFALLERTLQVHEREEERFAGPYPYRYPYSYRYPYGYYPYYPTYYRRETRYRAVATVQLFRKDPPVRAAGIYEVEEVLRRTHGELRLPGQPQSID